MENWHEDFELEARKQEQIQQTTWEEELLASRSISSS